MRACPDGVSSLKLCKLRALGAPRPWSLNHSGALSGIPSVIRSCGSHFGPVSENMCVQPPDAVQPSTPTVPATQQNQVHAHSNGLTQPAKPSIEGHKQPSFISTDSVAYRVNGLCSHGDGTSGRRGCAGPNSEALHALGCRDLASELGGMLNGSRRL